jgi:hypothetical protein
VNRSSARLVGGVTPGPQNRSSESDFDSGGPLGLKMPNDFSPSLAVGHRSVGKPIPIGGMGREGLLRNLERSLCCCSVLAGPLQCRDGLALAIEIALRPLNAQLGGFNKEFQVRPGHPEA